MYLFKKDINLNDFIQKNNHRAAAVLLTNLLKHSRKTIIHFFLHGLSPNKILLSPWTSHISFFNHSNYSNRYKTKQFSLMSCTNIKIVRGRIIEVREFVVNKYEPPQKIDTI